MAIDAYAGVTIQANVGIFGTIKLNKLAKAALLAMDPGYVDFEFQFVPQNFIENDTELYGDASSLSVENPVQQWLRGDLKTITFDAMFFAHHAAHSIEDYVAYLRRAKSKDSKLGRPPVWNFVYGQVVDETVVIESLGGIRYGELRSNATEGTIRDIYMSVTLRKYRFYDLQVTDPNKVPSDTFYKRSKEGDTFEHLAFREYGSAKYGDVVRQKHPATPRLVPNDLVAMPKFESIRNQPIEPSSIPLTRLPEQIAVKADLFALRGGARYSSVL